MLDTLVTLFMNGKGGGLAVHVFIVKVPHYADLRSLCTRNDSSVAHSFPHVSPTKQELRNCPEVVRMRARNFVPLRLQNNADSEAEFSSSRR